MEKKHCSYLKKIKPIIFFQSLAFLIVLLLLLTLPNPKASAQVMEGGEYKLRLEEVLDTESTPTPIRKIALPTITTAPTPPPIQSFGQSEILVSDDFVQFGPLSPTNPVIRQLRFSIRGQTLPFSLFQQMDHNLLNDPGQSIPPTSCDNGSCTETQASLWSSTLTYGLGVRCENIKGTACPDDFLEKNTFRPLGILSSGAASIIASGITGEQTELSLLYKLVVPGTQEKGNYQARASYILVPEL